MHFPFNFFALIRQCDAFSYSAPPLGYATDPQLELHYSSLGWSSDSDIFSRARLSSSAIMCAHHRKTSFGDFKDLCERHENVVYRKKGEELWRREEHMNGAEKNEPEIGESQIEV